MTPRGRPITLTEDELLTAARDVFLARGLDATTAEIAQRARISESVIFYRYKTKEALFAAVFERQVVLPPVCARLSSRVGEGEIAENLFDAGMGLVALMEGVLPFMMMSFCSTKMNLLGRRAHKPHPIKRQIIGLLSAYFEGEAHAGRLRAIKGEIAASTFFGGITQYVMAEHLERSADPLGIPTFLRGMIDLLLQGTRVPQGTPVEAAGRSAARPAPKRVAGTVAKVVGKAVARAAKAPAAKAPKAKTAKKGA